MVVNKERGTSEIGFAASRSFLNKVLSEQSVMETNLGKSHETVSERIAGGFSLMPKQFETEPVQGFKRIS